MNSLEKYLRELRDIRSTGSAVKETSYYPALVGLLNEIGKTLKPKVRCVLTPKNQGAGIPDIGLFVSRQRFDESEAFINLLPERGVLEVKGTKDEVAKIAQFDQVNKYLQRYGQVLVTNYRDFLLVSKDAGELEAYRLADNEAVFWQAAAHPEDALKMHGERFVEYLKRVLLSNAPLEAPADVAWFLASYARDAKARVEAAGQVALDSIRKALEEALGIQFKDEKGEHFFRSTLVQTLFYGVFSAWVLWHKQAKKPNDQFDWRLASHYLRVPILRKLFHEVSEPGQLERLNLPEVLDWTAAALNRVNRAEFFSRFEAEHAVQYFYEPFLEAFDPELRKQLGVWYTPSEIVEYMVARVDTVLREELHLADGLADPNVYVLDPCCGTGAYLVEVLKRIDRTLKERGEEALAAEELKHAAIHRVFGFEILPAPFVVAHLQMGLLLQSLGAPMGKDERAGVYLTNALTGWEPPTGPKQKLLYPELEEERDAAEKVKRNTPILVVLGNPPYNGFAGVAVTEERSLTNAYRTTKRAPAPQGQGLNDLYVRFFRMAERRIVELSRKGVVCFISNYSWLDGLSFTGMRERYLEAFDRVWIDCLNGDKYKTGKLTPAGEPDPSVFSTEWNREGIQVGTGISLLVRKEKHGAVEAVQFRHLWGKRKREELLETLHQDDAKLYEQIAPPLHLGLPFMPMKTEEQYANWPLLPDIFPASFPGVQTSRDDVVVDIDRERLLQRMQQYFDPKISHEDMKRIAPGVMEKGARFEAEKIRDYLRKRGFLPENIVRFSYRPFDVRWLYWEPETKLLDEKRSEYFPHVSEGNFWIAATQRVRKGFEPPLIAVKLGCRHIIESGANFFPLFLKPEQKQHSLFDQPTDNEPQPNLSAAALSYL
ncbi:MAG: N-6 DNA methylase, partial [Blastocatellia bacterium]|nr:N-6 DNA methylase [Blastocatellia bacterium]